MGVAIVIGLVVLVGLAILWGVSQGRSLHARIEQDLEVLAKKKAELIYADDYGRTVLDAWEDEVEYYVKNILKQSEGVGQKAWKKAVDDRVIKYYYDLKDKESPIL